MELLLFWVSTVIISLGMEVNHELMMYKDAADHGYKFNKTSTSNDMKQVKSNDSKTNTISLLVPILNVILATKKTVQYNKARNIIINQFGTMDSVIPMKNEEVETYRQNPCAINAFIINIVDENKSQNYVKFKDQGTIWFIMKDTEIVITKSEGPISRLSAEDQHSKLVEVITNFNKAIIEQLMQKELEKQQKSYKSIDNKRVKIESDNQIENSEDLNTNKTLVKRYRNKRNDY